MISIALSALLIPYALIAASFMVMAMVNIYHLVHYGATTRMSFVITFVFYAVSVLIIFFTLQALEGTDWSQTFNLNLFRQDF
ncbi:hypothetical protein HY633_02570 [Candidatus Uhrbacteria bacterium]|nr:hypothetical protein [Candidatus Uhrbacteria bacterium]